MVVPSTGAGGKDRLHGMRHEGLATRGEDPRHSVDDVAAFHRTTATAGAVERIGLR